MLHDVRRLVLGGSRYPKILVHKSRVVNLQPGRPVSVSVSV